MEDWGCRAKAFLVSKGGSGNGMDIIKASHCHHFPPFKFKKLNL